MRISVIGGFLGSGKTTAIKSIAKRLSMEGERVAIIVNEIGSVGIDGDILERYGLKTKELYGGCICCTLKIDLMTTIKSMQEQFAPTHVIIEPTGIAIPTQIGSDLSAMGIANSSFSPVVTIVDGTRFEKIIKFRSAFYQRQIEGTEVLCLNKADMMDETQIASVMAQLKAINPGAYTMPMSAMNEEGLDTLLGLLHLEGKAFRSEGDECDSVELSGVSTYSAEYELVGPDGHDPTAMAKKILELISEKTSIENPEFVGHIKLYLAGNDRSARGSVTSAFSEPQVEPLGIGEERNRLKILSAIGNIDKHVLERIVDGGVESVLKGMGVEPRKVEKHHAHHHHHEDQ